MPNLTSVLREEIRRLARKEVKDNTQDLQRRLTEQRKRIADLRKRVDVLERENRQLLKKTGDVGARAGDAGGEEDEGPGSAARARFSGKSILKLRHKLRLTQGELAQLAGVSPQSVYQWERKGGPLRLRNATKAALVEVRGMGLREARQRLEQQAE